MILRRHVPGPPLARFIEFFWYYEGWNGGHARERVLPDGSFELIINLVDGPRKLFERDDSDEYTAYRGGWLSGTHSRYIVIDAVEGASMIGAHFRPGGARPFVGAPAADFLDQVVELEAVWGKSAGRLREQLLEAPGPSGKFRELEAFLTERLRRARTDESRQQKMRWASATLGGEPDVTSIGKTAAKLGISHKHFISQFRHEVGLSPKVFCRIRRLQEALAAIHQGQVVRWAEVACACGYYDQSHLIREFQEFAGLNPSAYRALDEDYPSFVPVDEPR